MSASYTHAVIAGKCTADPQIKTSDKGTEVAVFDIAINHKYTDGAGKKVEEVSYVPIVFYGKPVQNIQKYVFKGTAILVDGRIQQKRWESKGEKKSRLQIVGDTWKLLAEKPQPESQPAEEPAEIDY